MEASGLLGWHHLSLHFIPVVRARTTFAGCCSRSGLTPLPRDMQWKKIDETLTVPPQIGTSCTGKVAPSRWHCGFGIIGQALKNTALPVACFVMITLPDHCSRAIGCCLLASFACANLLDNEDNGSTVCVFSIMWWRIHISITSDRFSRHLWYCLLNGLVKQNCAKTSWPTFWECRATVRECLIVELRTSAVCLAFWKA